MLGFSSQFQLFLVFGDRRNSCYSYLNYYLQSISGLSSKPGSQVCPYHSQLQYQTGDTAWELTKANWLVAELSADVQVVTKHRGTEYNLVIYEAALQVPTQYSNFGNVIRNFQNKLVDQALKNDLKSFYYILQFSRTFIRLKV